MPRGDSSPRQVVACALRLFSERGVAATSLQMIASDLGVTKAAIYHHFRTKEEIVRAVLAPAFAGFAALVSEARRLPEPQRAAALIDSLAEQAVANRLLYSVVLGDLSAAQLRRESADHLASFRALREILAGPHPTAASRARATVFLSGLMGPHTDPDLQLDDETLHHALVSAGHRMLVADPVTS